MDPLPRLADVLGGVRGGSDSVVNRDDEAADTASGETGRFETGAECRAVSEAFVRVRMRVGISDVGRALEFKIR